MLPRELGGVVDPTLKVYGTSNVRVVDLSILPLHVTVHPQGNISSRILREDAADQVLAAFVYGIAEKGWLRPSIPTLMLTKVSRVASDIIKASYSH